MPQYQTSPKVEYNRLPASTGTDTGELINMAMQMQSLQANREDARFLQRQTSYQNQMNMINMIDQNARRTAKSADKSNPNKATIDQLEYLKARNETFKQVAAMAELQRDQESREADFLLQEPLAQLGAYAGTQNWGSFYAQRKSLVANPLFNRSRQVRQNVQAIDQMLGQWGQAYDSHARAKNFLDVSKDAESSDWETRKEALRILALKSESPSGFLASVPNLSAMQRGELMSFIESNPLVHDERKIMQLQQFENTFQQSLMASAGGDPQAYLNTMSDPETQRKMADARRAILYGKPSDDVTYIGSDDKAFSADTLERLNQFINSEIDDSAGILSLTRWAREGYTGVRRLMDKDFGKLTDEEMIAVQSPDALKRLADESGVMRDLSQSLAAGGALYMGKLLDNFTVIKRGLDSGWGNTALEQGWAKTMGTLSKAQRAEFSNSITSFIKAAKAHPNLTVAAQKLGGKGAGIVRALMGAAKGTANGAGFVLKHTLPAEVLAPLAKKVGLGALGKKAGAWTAGKAAAAGGAKLAGKVAGTAVGLGLDAIFFMKDAGNDMGQVTDAINVIKNNQKIMQTAASRGEIPVDINQLMGQTQLAIQQVNTITQRHGINVELSLNNVISKQMASRFNTRVAVEASMRSAYSLPQPVTIPQTPPRASTRVGNSYSPQVTYDDIGVNASARSGDGGGREPSTLDKRVQLVRETLPGRIYDAVPGDNLAEKMVTSQFGGLPVVLKTIDNVTKSYMEQ